MKFVFTLLSLFLFQCAPAVQQADKIDLSGIWRFQLDPMGFGKIPGSELYQTKLTETIMLPGSTDQAGKGIPNQVAYVDRLSRKYEYCGQAWYQREILIPQDWSGKEIILNLERCHWETAVYVDGALVGTDERLCTPNRFVLTKYCTPGTHILTLCVDNRMKYPMDVWNHTLTEHAQTNWNGIVGEISLEAKMPDYIKHVKVYPDIENGQVTAKIYINSSEKAVKGNLMLTVSEKNGKILASDSEEIELSSNQSTVERILSVGKKFKLWDEFNPALYNLTVEWTVNGNKASVCEQFGFRKVEKGAHHIRLNGRNIHLRGLLDCAVFPLTGYPATDVESWLRIFRTVKEYGLNHVRFHSWCPPEAAFYAADEIGLYLQVELPMWVKNVGKYPERRDFFEKEMYAVLDEYGNHPSFLLMCNGNENEGDFTVLEDLVKKGQSYDNRHLYSASTARDHVKSDEFYVSHLTEKGWITVYDGQPSTDWDRSKESDIDVPVIAHESGQRCMFPNFNETSKYTGVLEPRNFQIFKQRLAANGMLHKADDFFKATGAHTVLQYKEVNEALMRTANSGGFQLLGLSDFPGQGSAFVGILDAFWDSKGLVTPEKYRESCAPVVLLARFPKRTYLNSESFNVKLEIYQYGEKNLAKGSLDWCLIGENQKVMAKGKLGHAMLPVGGVDSLGQVQVPLHNIQEAGKYTFRVCLDNGIQNEWDIWVYPQEISTLVNNIQYVNTWEDAKQKLGKGENVLFIPSKVNGRNTKFTGHFWNPVMFNWDPMIVGTWIDSSHPAFQYFPTSYYADWQWWDILNYGKAVDLTDLYELEPVIQSIDTYEVNRKLAIAFEVKVGDGKLFVLCMDIQKDMDKRIAMKQLLYSINAYVHSTAFSPKTEVPSYLLDAIFLPEAERKVKSEENAAIRQLLNQ